MLNLWITFKGEQWTNNVEFRCTRLSMDDECSCHARTRLTTLYCFAFSVTYSYLQVINHAKNTRNTLHKWTEYEWQFISRMVESFSSFRWFVSNAKQLNPAHVSIICYMIIKSINFYHSSSHAQQSIGYMHLLFWIEESLSLPCK